ncbi:aspartate ammonia-lyase [Pusillimonas sp.]|uniref:aspartate ammonia-lyase n=1 Tax=Pusillimonas sp. TaxID=3040095 RepID=UPI0029B39DAB|nr:aspartate ammonia-lyase [Pusillimonas sp.]MDX3895891.1 aspartate ammonia-lyase [Pusillimonas sp.]
MSEFRIERDLLGEREVPIDAYYGVHTLRACENFQISGAPVSIFPELVVALASVKQAAAEANTELGLLATKKRDVIVAACEEVRGGALHDQFVVDVIQGGAGTSTNMNANEVICNRALELMGHERGQYKFLHPNEDVNMAQSTNDVYPTALRIATLFSMDRLLAAMEHLRAAFDAKAVEFSPLLKIGRTQLQDAVPMTLGQEFSTYARMLEEDIMRLGEAKVLISEINLGATAIGTGITAHPDYAAKALQSLNRITGLTLCTAPNLIEATQDCGAFVQLSGLLKRIAVKLSKVCSDLRLLSSGPRSGFGEINLPPMQAGSSIMPGKVNPVIPEVVNQIAFEVIGNDLTVTMAAEAGQLQLNAFEPIIANALFRSFKHLTNGCMTLADRCVKGITANPERLKSNLDRSISLVTALNPFIGYEAATAVAAEAYANGTTVRDVILHRQLMTESELDDALRHEVLTQPRVYELVNRAQRVAPPEAGDENS